MAEVVVVHGPPGSGKSVHSQRLASEGFRGKDVDHVSAGDRLRAIRTGKVNSAYSDVVNPAPGYRVLLDHTIMTGVIFEYVDQASDNTLMLIDGYPRFADAVGGFIHSVKDGNHTLLGCLNLQVPKNVSVDRVAGRGKRIGEVVDSDQAALRKLAEERYQEHLDFTMHAIAALGSITEVINVNAKPPMEVVWGSFCRGILTLVNG